MIGTYRTKVIFTTTFDSFALEGFKVDALAYLLKPIAYADFLKAAHKALRYIDASPVSGAPTRITVKSGYKLQKIALDDILYLEALRNYVAIYTASGEKITTIATLQHLADELPEALFARVHRSFIVNLPKARCSLFVIHYSLFTIRYSLFVIHYITTFLYLCPHKNFNTHFLSKQAVPPKWLAEESPNG
ncbi:MAG: LytTR family DNA-binding domain-containing protein [Prevotellaceae bacterium]|nr:LytTR family DNA-binding domain-containing protein [Prevotellaceae bacterium]